MASAVFRIKDHVIPCQHIRQYPRATLDSQEEVLHLSVKQYTPLDNLNPRPGDVTIIGAHANGFPKELYEPLWVDLHARAKKFGFRIRGIWIADQAHQGTSGVLNENKLGDDPSWMDHSRDLLHMINHFRAEISRPIMGIGHSMGGCQLVQLALIHPRLLESLVLLDPVIQGFTAAQGNISPARASAFRRDIWPSREAAAIAFKKSKFYQTWDPRVLDLWIQYGLRELPTKVYPKMPEDVPTKNTSKPVPPVTAEPTLAPQPARPVTLTTTKHQEVFTFLRPNFPPDDNPDAPGPHTLTDSNLTQNRITHPDITPRPEPQSPFYRGEAIFTFHQLPHLRPSVFYIFGALSYMSSYELRSAKLAVTGTGVGGSGGAPEGRVKEYVMEGTGHLVPMERSSETADCCAEWISAELARWKANEPVNMKEWEGVPREERYKLREKFINKVSGDLPGLPAMQKSKPKEKL